MITNISPSQKTRQPIESIAITTLVKIIVDACIKIDEFDSKKYSWQHELASDEFKKRKQSFENTEDELIALGEKLDEVGGFDAMLHISNLSSKVYGRAGKLTNYYWDGVGEWVR